MEYFMLVMTKDQMANLKESDLREHVLKPLMEKMGYGGVALWHGGAGELGKDLVGWKVGDFGARVPIATVAKAKRVVGNVAVEAARQVRLAFNTTFVDKVGNQQLRPQQVWVVTNKDAPKESRDQILCEFNEQQRSSILIIDIDELWKEWELHFDVYLYQALLSAQNHMRDLDPALKPRVWVESDSLGVDIGVARPELLTSEHTEVKIDFSFPNTPEGRAKALELENSYKRGAEVEISSDYFKLNMPGALRKITEHVLGVSADAGYSLRISSPENPRRIPMRIVIHCDDRDHVVLEYIEWRIVRQGTEEITFSSDHQPIPICFRLTISLVDQSSNFHFELREQPVSATWLKKWADIKRCVAKPGRLTFSFVETGVNLGWGRLHGQPGFKEDRAGDRMLTDLAAFEAKIARPIFVPLRAFTPDEVRTIEHLRFILKNPVLPQRWDGGTARFLWNAEEAREMLEALTRNPETQIRSINEQSVVLFGTEIPLGRVEQVMETARLANEAQLREQVQVLELGEAEFEIEFVPGSSSRAWARYLDWDAIPQEVVDAGKKKGRVLPGTRNSAARRGKSRRRRR
jgi:hypothetical protein